LNFSSTEGFRFDSVSETGLSILQKVVETFLLPGASEFSGTIFSAKRDKSAQSVYNFGFHNQLEKTLWVVFFSPSQPVHIAE
jgi:hypothetical protein